MREETQKGVLSSLLEGMLMTLLFLFFLLLLLLLLSFWTSFISWRAGSYVPRRAFNSLTSHWGLATKKREISLLSGHIHYSSLLPSQHSTALAYLVTYLLCPPGLLGNTQLGLIGNKDTQNANHGLRECLIQEWSMSCVCTLDCRKKHFET